MVLADTAVWIDHFRARGSHLAALLWNGQATMHAHVIGELALGSLKDRVATLDDLANLPRAPLASEEEVRDFIEARKLFAPGIGYTDAHLLASVMLGGAMKLWTMDARLASVADDLGVAYRE